MKTAKIRNFLEAGTNIAVLLAAITVVGFFAKSYFAPQNSQPQQNPQPQQTGLKVGQNISQNINIDYKSSPRTLMIILDTNCKFCAASVPFYKQLLKEQSKRAEFVNIVGLFPDPSEQVNKFLEENQLPMKTVSNISLSEVGMKYTPSLVLIDNSGKVLNTWVGQLPPEGEKNVIETIGSYELKQ